MLCICWTHNENCVINLLHGLWITLICMCHNQMCKVKFKQIEPEITELIIPQPVFCFLQQGFINIVQRCFTFSYIVSSLRSVKQVLQSCYIEYVYTVKTNTVYWIDCQTDMCHEMCLFQWHICQLDCMVLIPLLTYYRLHANNSYGQQNNETEKWNCIAEKLNFEVLQNNCFFFGKLLTKESGILIFVHWGMCLFLLLSYFFASVRQVFSPIKNLRQLKKYFQPRKSLTKYIFFFRWTTVFKGMALMTVCFRCN